MNLQDKKDRLSALIVDQVRTNILNANQGNPDAEPWTENEDGVYWLENEIGFFDDLFTILYPSWPKPLEDLPKMYTQVQQVTRRLSTMPLLYLEMLHRFMLLQGTDGPDVFNMRDSEDRRRVLEYLYQSL